MTITTTPATYAEFPEVTIPACLQGGRWEDASYHHDAMPHSAHPAPAHYGAGAEVEAWVNFPAEADRSKLGPAYLMQIAAPDQAAQVLYHGDDLAELEAAVAAIVAVWGDQREARLALVQARRATVEALRAGPQDDGSTKWIP